MTKDKESSKSTVPKATRISMVVKDVTRVYSDLNHVFYDFYKDYLKTTPANADRAVHAIYEKAQTFKNDATHFGNLMVDVSEPAHASGIHVAKVLANSAVFLFFASLCSFVGSYITAPFFNLILLETGAVLMAAFVIPCCASFFYYHYNGRQLSENKKRVFCATFVLEQSLLIGFVNQNTWLETPFTLTIPIIVSFTYPILLEVVHDRVQILGGIAGASLLSNLVLGYFMLNFSSGYLMVAILYTLIVIALVQYTIAYRNHSDFDVMYVAMQYTLLVSATKMVSLITMGNPN